ncbi:MAG TPA: Holliday junction branch migration protein RuvA [Steroidobacteraceae bacterium]|nr:Holliday junction branch migration protein RuvA [Steroidobacteraceae bacterium]
MIGWLRGRLAAKHPPVLVVDVNGVGYECEAPMSTFYALPETGADVTLRTHLVVREDAHSLYAFGTDEERRLFRSLLKVGGIGPKIALGILSGISVDAFMVCIESQDPDPLVRVPGVGRKTAERLLIEMRDRVKELAGARAALPPAVGRAAAAQHEAYSALVALGYRPVEITRLLRVVADEEASTEELIRRALKAAAG